MTIPPRRRCRLGELMALAAATMLSAALASACTPERCEFNDEEMAERQRLAYAIEQPRDWKPLPSCPGSDDENPGIADFTVGNIRFHIPRSDLPYGSTEADGRAMAFGFKIYYPVHQSTIVIAHSYNTNESVCAIGACDSVIQEFFLNTAGVRLRERSNSVIKDSSTLRQSSLFEKFIEFESSAGGSLHVRNTIERPREWISCDLSRRICKSYEFFQGMVYVTMHFPANALARYQKLREEVIARLQEYCGCELRNLP